MEANEVQELEEHAENVEHDKMMRPVALTMTVLAVLVAVATVLGHRTHTEVVLNMVKTSDLWSEYQAHKIRANQDEDTAKLLGVVTIADEPAAVKLEKQLDAQKEKKADEIKEDKEKAEAMEQKVEVAEVRANRFDLAETLLEIGLVITSITLLTRKRLYWMIGLVCSAAGIAAAIFGLLLS